MKKLTEKQKVHNERKSRLAMERLSKSKKTCSQNEEEPYNSKVVDRIINLTHGKFDIKKVTAEIKIPSNFSLIQNPREALTTIGKLANTARGSQKIKSFNIDHSKVADLDLAAEAVLDLIAAEIEREYKSRNKQLNFSGNYPPSDRLQRLLRGIGIIRSLKVTHEYLPKSQGRKIEVFEKNSKNQETDAGSLSYVELTAKKFVDHINNCLKRVNRKLTDDAVDRLSTYTGEIIGNAEEHSGENAWYIAGYYDDNDESHLCEITIFNFGKTFAETFTELPRDSFAYQAVSPYIEKHRVSEFFASGWDEKNLLTLVALQGDVSSKNTSEDDTRGNGTVEMIEFFDRISYELSPSDSSPEMAIISGSSHIRFDGTYSLGDDDSERKIIAFNQPNDLNHPPDKEYVSNLAPLYFPGTIISIRFKLSENETLSLRYE